MAQLHKPSDQHPDDPETHADPKGLSRVPRSPFAEQVVGVQVAPSSRYDGYLAGEQVPRRAVSNKPLLNRSASPGDVIRAPEQGPPGQVQQNADETNRDPEDQPISCIIVNLDGSHSFGKPVAENHKPSFLGTSHRTGRQGHPWMNDIPFPTATRKGCRSMPSSRWHCFFHLPTNGLPMN